MLPGRFSFLPLLSTALFAAAQDPFSWAVGFSSGVGCAETSQTVWGYNNQGCTSAPINGALSAQASMLDGCTVLLYTDSTCQFLSGHIVAAITAPGRCVSASADETYASYTVSCAQITPPCNSGTLQCCNSVQSMTSSSVATIIGLLGINIAVTPNSLVGVTCSPISSIGFGGSCSAQPVCCTGNFLSGLLAFGCTPVNLNF